MFYLGMDVAEATLDCCLLLDEVGGKRKSKVVPNSKAGIVYSGCDYRDLYANLDTSQQHHTSQVVQLRGN